VNSKSSSRKREAKVLESLGAGVLGGGGGRGGGQSFL